MENFPVFNSSLSFGIACHDAGGANQIIAILQASDLIPAAVHVVGPAKKLWNEAYSDRFRISKDFLWIKQVSVVITGTGWSSEFEHQARLYARASGVYSISVMDHWVNYKERFLKKNELILPDELWVVDEYAEKIARNEFPNTKIILRKDCYAERELCSIIPINDLTPNELLYLLEPIRNNWGYPEPGEIQALKFFLRHLNQLLLPKDARIKLRVHPSESTDKYLAYEGMYHGYQVSISTESLVDSLSSCRWAAGCQTYAMTLALRAGRKVFGSLPPWAPGCALPHDGIIQLKDWIMK